MHGQREEQKQRTRARILAAARRLFDDPGYEATTIRMIAAEAGVAAGSVFTTFESKEDVLFAITGEIFNEMGERLAASLTDVEGSAREKVKLFFAEVVDAMGPHLPLMMVHFGLAWRWSHEVESGRPSHLGRIFQAAGDMLQEGVRTGELPPDTDLALLAEVLTDICVRNIRRAWYRKLDRASLAALTARQVDLVFDGACGRT